ncbi:MAG: TRAP transporter substrate-binding protein [Candidatus Competibacteraceae bacterium]|nr:TRAP transporter substrate-binding protein [Candidatus Competibacteraceae bacterium]MCB1813796.1 TRAP transporter substrate-binding protein [Candidatus Competibacteraceae bacterium]
MTMRRVMVAAINISFALLLALSSAQAQPLKLRLSVESTPGAPTQHILASFRDALQTAFGDQVEIEYFDSGTLGDEIVHMQQVRTGQLDVIPIGSDAVQLDPKWAVFDIPFLFSDRAAVAKVLDGEVGAQLDASFQERAGLKVLGFGEIGFRNISNNVRPVVVPDDLKGLKLRTPGSKTRILSFEMLGASPIKMNIGEVYLALQQGVVDGQENPLSNIRKWSWYEVQKYISVSHHVYTPITFVMNLAKYQSLTDAQRTAVDQAAREAVLASRAYGEESDNKLVAEIKELAKGQTAFNEIDLVAFKKAAKPIAVEIGKVAGEEFTASVMAAVE